MRKLSIALLLLFAIVMGCSPGETEIVKLYFSGKDCTDEPIITEWKGLCDGDIVFYKFLEDTATFVITKIVIQPGEMSDDIGGMRLRDGKYVWAQERWVEKVE